jgi:hypothetical protein
MASLSKGYVVTTAPEQSAEAKTSIFKVCAFTDPSVVVVQVPAAEVGR